MGIHKEGHGVLIAGFLFLLALNLFILWIFDIQWGWCIIPSIILFVLLLQFFRKPHRPVPERDDRLVYAPADGKVVVLEQTRQTEMPGEACIQISIFMSPLNVHINWAPVSGQIRSHRHDPGKYLMAWNPKSSTENEQFRSVWQTKDGTVIVLKQIAGFMARRIIPYINEGKQFEQGEEIGFIRFGSRVDVLLPPDADIKVRRGDSVRGKRTVIAHLAKS